MVLGQTESGADVRIDLPTLIETRLLVQAMSGGGKSWTLRRLLEQSHGKVQHVVLDPEGEFASLRARFDYVLIGKGGDRAARSAEAGMLARSVLELQCNVICDLYELQIGERKRFVRLFLEALVNAPKALWHPALVMIDEAHAFCPQKREAESASAIIDLLARGRKRGFCAVLATQRLAKLDKDAAAECANVMVGRTVQDVDRSRALDVLAVARDRQRQINQELMTLPAGQFYSVGTAFRPQLLTGFRVGPVQTRHPAVGKARLMAAPPPPSSHIKAMLAKLDHLSRDLEEEADERESLRAEVADLNREVARLQRDLRAAQEAQPARRDLDEFHRREIHWEARLTQALAELARYRKALEGVPQHLTEAARSLAQLPAAFPKIEPPPLPSWARAETTEAVPREPTRANSGRSSPLTPIGGTHLRAGARRMLEVLARHHPAVMTRAQLATLSRFSSRGGTFNTYLGDLKRAGHIDLDGREVRPTSEGLAACGHVVRTPMTTAEVLEQWRTALRAGARRMLDILVDLYPGGLTRSALAEQSEFTASGGTFGTYLGDLRRNGLIEEMDGEVRASPVVMGTVG